MSTTLFLLAHQDDEIGVLAEIERMLADGERPVFAYLTDGATRGVTPQQRNAESLAVLGRLGVPGSDVHFLGQQVGISDGRLVTRLEAAYAAAVGLHDRLGVVDRIVMHGWEGGHQDHDAVHVLGVALAVQVGSLRQARQFPLYRAPLAGPLPYVMLRPLPANGRVETRHIPLLARLRYLRMCLGYRSQARTFAGLLPFILLEYVLHGRQVLQPVSVARLQEPPHAEVVLFERWQRMTWEEFAAAADAFLARRGLGRSGAAGG